MLPYTICALMWWPASSKSHARFLGLNSSPEQWPTDPVRTSTCQWPTDPYVLVRAIEHFLYYFLNSSPNVSRTEDRYCWAAYGSLSRCANTFQPTDLLLWCSKMRIIEQIWSRLTDDSVMTHTSVLGSYFDTYKRREQECINRGSVL